MTHKLWVIIKLKVFLASKIIFEFIQTKRARQNCNNSLEIDYLHTVVNSDIIPPSKVKSNTYK